MHDEKSGQQVLDSQPPSLSAEQAARLVEGRFGIAATARQLLCERDQTFRLTAAKEKEFVLKVFNAAEDPAVVDFQVEALRHIAGQAPSLPVPRVVLSHDGRAHEVVRREQGTEHRLCLLTYLPGTMAKEVPPNQALRRTAAQHAAWMGQALRGFFHPAAGRALPWDIRQAAFARSKTQHIRDESHRRRAEQVFDRFDTVVKPRLSGLRAQVIHNDMQVRNLLVDPKDTDKIVGIIDFGDMVHAPLVQDIATTAAGFALKTPDPLAAVGEILAAYHAVEPLSNEELGLVFDLTVTRLAMIVSLASWQGETHPENQDYLLLDFPETCEALERLSAVDRGFALGHLRRACSLPAFANAQRVAKWLADQAEEIGPLLSFDLGSAPKTRLSPAQEATEPGTPSPSIADGGLAIGACRQGRGEPQKADRSGEAAAQDLGIELYLPVDTEVLAPLAGRLQAPAPGGGAPGEAASLVLRHEIAGGPAFCTRLGGLAAESLAAPDPGRVVEQGTRLGSLHRLGSGDASFARLHVQILGEPELPPEEVPSESSPERAASWLAACPDPNLLLRLPPEAFAPPESDPAGLQSRRQRRLGPNLKTFYERPFEIVRGQGARLIDSSGRAYLDAYNNVPQVGHNHPAVVDAMARQAARLNTNTRYIYRTVLDYADRLVGTLPKGLDVCLFVNSGSEANDLAWRMAKRYSGAEGVLVYQGAYHGCTDAVSELSPCHLKRDLAPYVREVEAPDDYRGPYRRSDPERAARYADHLDGAIESLAAGGHKLAALMVDPILASSGIMIPPPGYAEAAFAKVRAAGALCIVDEVQTGFGRLAPHMWGFEALGVTPDIVTLGKPIGNGYPLGAVITTQEIAHAFSEQEDFFSTFGGNPVGSAAGLAVLEVIEREDLCRQAHEVGDFLMGGLRNLSERHDLIGDCRGMGFYIGVELVRDRATLEPATEEAKLAINRMQEAGVLVGRDGLFGNVLKIRPPLIFSRSDATLLVRALDGVLSGLSR